MLPTRRNVLKTLTKNLVIGGLCVFLNACVIAVDDRHRSDFGSYGDHSYAMWFDDADIYCEYDSLHQRSKWTLVAAANTSYGPAEVESIWVEILGSYLHTYVSVFELTPALNGEWMYSFDNQGSPEGSYHCMNYYEFEFVAYDYDGYYTSTWVSW